MWTDSIEKIFVINTDDEIGRRRWFYVTLEVNFHNLSVERYEAVKQDDGAKGLLKTMHKLFNEAQGNVLVFEDDFKLLGLDAEFTMNKAMAQLPKDFDLLYLGCNLLMPPVVVSENILQVQAAYSSHAILYSKKGIDLILSLWSEEKPYDMFLMQKIQPYGKCYCVSPMLASQRKGVSSIYVNENKPGMERYYDSETKEIDWGLMMEEKFKMFVP